MAIYPEKIGKNINFFIRAKSVCYKKHKLSSVIDQLNVKRCIKYKTFH